MTLISLKTATSIFRTQIACFFALSISSTIPLLTNATEANPALTAAENYSPYADTAFPDTVYWGDTHVHTAYSVDAALLGRTQLMPDKAYRFARGETIVATNGESTAMIRPLDFIVISDHAAYMGLMQDIGRSSPLLLATDIGKRWHDAVREGGEARTKAMFEILFGLAQPDKIGSIPLRRSMWDSVIDNAEQFNEPNVFTAFIGYEWTSSSSVGDNLHRNVIFRDGGEYAGQVLPFSAQDSMDPERLWAFLASYEEQTGGQVMAIPHNGNLSNGLMFAPKRFNGEPFDTGYVERRSRWEPLYEVTQIKGDGETHPVLSPDDEFADFENWDIGNLSSLPKPPNAYRYEYARSALQQGLQHEATFGTNPFKFGMIGSTDSHTGLVAAREENFWGKFSKFEPGNERITTPVLPFNPEFPGSEGLPGWKSVASGYAAVWARENTREALFSAMLRKEVYATTGPRMTVRFFGGFDFESDDIDRPDYARIGYIKGVPMGGDLHTNDSNEAPSFLVSAIKDPDGANLDRVQIIKGWQSDDGAMRERIYDVAVSDDRRINRHGRAKKSVGSTVDVVGANYTNSIGTAQLAAFWQDPDFDAEQRAFYYVRVIEIPKPRWTAYDAKTYGRTMSDEVTMTVQDRAYTTPIWYTP